ncbi:hypothetical protein, partial [Listeria booriae]|uniref:hypothetical protein n=1 Tax=Listeria booriae TaxID=1552123 RepID=UPI001C8AE7F9
SFLWINPSLRSRLYWERNSLCSNASKKHLLEYGGKRLAMASLSDGDLVNIASFLWINPSLRSRLYWERNSLCSNAPNKKAQSLGLGTPSCSVVYA